MGLKKHYTQMTQDEKYTLENYLRTSYYFTPYSLSRIDERNISESMVYDTIFDGEIIEYHYASRDEHRILLRGRKQYNNCNICVVIDIFNKEIVTVYDNKVNDKHYTLNKSEYRKSMDILKQLLM